MSTNPDHPQSNAEGTNADNDDEKPGTSASFFQPSSKGAFSKDTTIPPDNGSDESSPNSSLKIRNASRERPSADLPPQDVKRQKIVREDDPMDNDEGIRMDTDSSSEDEDDRMKQNAPIELDSDEAVSIEQASPGTTKKVSSCRSSNSDEGVSTTIPVSSLKHGSNPSVDQPDSHPAQFRVSDAMASTSATALAPSLSRMMENSQIIEDIYRLPALEASDHFEGAQQRRSWRDTTPDPRSSAHVENLYFQQNAEMDVNENRGPEAFLQKMHGKQRLMWARKLFFLSTDLVFPGFKAYSDSKSQLPDYMGIRVRSSCVMQALLYADALFFIMWILSFLSTCDILITVLKQLHGYLSVCLTCLFIIVNILRLRFGLKGNENDEVQYLALFWMTTVIVQIPLFTFIFLTDLFCPVLLAFTVTMDGTMMVFILLESVVGFIHFRSLLRDELNVIRMARRSKEASQSRANIPLSSNRQEDLPISSRKNSSSHAAVDGDSSSDTDSESNRYGIHPENLDFRMHIRRLSETRHTAEQQNPEDDDSDSSEQVTSTSDTIRHRPIRAH